MKDGEMKIFLIGFMGSGKSVVGRRIAKRLGLEFVDMDQEIVRVTGMSIPEIFATHGESHFREIESEVLEKLDRTEGEMVVSCGGGVVEREKNREILKNRRTFYLFSPWEELWERIRRDPNRPLVARGEEKVKQLYDTRRPLYEETGKLIDTTGLSVEEVVEAILEKI